jgi:DNA-binding LacI/PurR family transcriptional regulator
MSPSRETRNIALVVLTDSAGDPQPSFATLLRGASLAAADNGLALTVHHVPSPQRIPLRLLNGDVGGVLLYDERCNVEIPRHLPNVPNVWVMSGRRRLRRGDHVFADSYQVGRMAAQYLIRNGHTRLAFLNLDRDHWPFRQYRQAFTDAAADQSISVVNIESARIPAPAVGDGGVDSPAAAVVSLVRRFLALNPTPTGLFIADDRQTAQLQPALQRFGIRLDQGATQIVSCNNDRPFLAALDPRPATIDIRAESIGRRGVEQLLWRMSHPTAERAVLLVEPVVVVSGEQQASPTMPSVSTPAQAVMLRPRARSVRRRISPSETLVSA